MSWYHPFSGDLSKLSDKEIIDKLGDLNKKLMMSYQYRHAQLTNQVQLMCMDYTDELRRREQEAFDKMQEENGDDWNDVINIE